MTVNQLELLTYACNIWSVNQLELLKLVFDTKLCCLQPH